MTEPITHAQLVARAVTWLRGTRRCTIVMAEAGSWYAGEIPDAIGWTFRGMSVLVECKISRADFRRDADKPARQRGSELMGAIRYYMAPVGVIPHDELRDGWGLVEVKRNTNGTLNARMTVRADEPTTQYGRANGREAREISLLVAELSRIARPPELVRCLHCGKLTNRRVGVQLAQADRAHVG